MSRCDHPHTYLAVMVCGNGAKHVGYYCEDCGGWEIRPGQRGKWLPHAGIDVDALPVVVEQGIAQCEHCKKHTWCELHHYAPRKLFKDADNWPTGWLCTPGCHEEWHAKIGLPIRGYDVDQS